MTEIGGVPRLGDHALQLVDLSSENDQPHATCLKTYLLAGAGEFPNPIPLGGRHVLSFSDPPSRMPS